MGNAKVSDKKIKEFFNRGSSKLSLDGLIELSGDLSDNRLSNYLFQLASISIDEYDGEENLDYVLNIFNYIKKVLDINSAINKKSVYKKIRKLYERIDNKLDCDRNKFRDYKKAEKELKKVSLGLDNLYDNLENKESKTYDFLKYVILDVHNLEYVERTFEEVKNIVNIKDKSGVSLFNNVAAKYLEAVDDPENSKDDLLYYNNLMMIMSEQENFKLLDEDKKMCLKKIYAILDNIKTKDKSSQAKKFYLDNLLAYLKEETFTHEDLIDNIGTKYNISTEFKKDMMEEVLAHKNPISKRYYKDRYIVDEYIMSIDDSYTTTIDDAISCRKLENGNYLLGVHVADILGYYDFNSKTIEEALDRVIPIYLSDSTKFPIMPNAIIKDEASLVEGVPKLARSYFYEISNSGEIVDSKVLKTIITNSEKTNYKVVDNIIRNNRELASNTIENLIDIKTILCQNNKFNPNIKSPSGKIVNNVSTLVNKQVGSYFNKEGYPCIYLNKVMDDAKKTREVQERLMDAKTGFVSMEHRNLIKAINCMCPKVLYSTSGERQEFDMLYYATVTSPLRKASDILVNHAMDVCYFNTPTDKEVYELESLLNERVKYMNDKMDAVKYFAMDYEVNKEKIKKR